MALQAVLSVFRQLILDGIDLPPTAAQREVLFRERFTELSDAEIEDLAKMEPSQLGIYTNSVFSAEGSILKNAFPLTLAVLEDAWPEDWGGYSTRTLARRIHKAAPWRGIHSMTLGESLRSFVGRECGRISAHAPWLLEAAQLEQTMLEIRRAPNEPVAPQSEAEIEQLAGLTVGELLALNAYVPALLREVQLTYDLLSVRRAVTEGEKLFAPNHLPQRLLGARPHDYGVLFVAVPDQVSLLMLESRGRDLPLLQIAEAFQASVAVQEASEDEAFRAFYSTLRALVAAGALSIQPLPTTTISR